MVHMIHMYVRPQELVHADGIMTNTCSCLQIAGIADSSVFPYDFLATYGLSSPSTQTTLAYHVDQNAVVLTQQQVTYGYAQTMQFTDALPADNSRNKVGAGVGCHCNM